MAKLTNEEQGFTTFLDEFVQQAQGKSEALNKAYWLLETTGSSDAAGIVAYLDTEYSLMFSDKAIFAKLTSWESSGKIVDPLLGRQLNVLIRSFKGNMLPKQVLEQLASESAQLAKTYANFRATYEGKAIGENDLIDVLKKESSVAKRKAAWAATKKIGAVMAPGIVDIVTLRNSAARTLGYDNYFSMTLALQEVDEQWLFAFLDDMYDHTQKCYTDLITTINTDLSAKFGVTKAEVGPWAWSDPFCQEDPIVPKDADKVVEGADVVALASKFYDSIGLDAASIISTSDLYERQGKNQHAFCINIDRKADTRVLANVRPNLRWWDTMLHELGHGVYELGIDKSLPWLLRTPPHMIPTEAMALMAGRLAYKSNSEVWESQRRRQLIFSRWVQVIVRFERELYKNPESDLNSLWWSLVEQYQGVKADGRKGGTDWAAKYHIGLAPVYYHSYLIGEVFASMLYSQLDKVAGGFKQGNKQAGKVLNTTLFAPGDSYTWDELIRRCVGEPLTTKYWEAEFCS